MHSNIYIDMKNNMNIETQKVLYDMKNNIINNPKLTLDTLQKNINDINSIYNQIEFMEESKEYSDLNEQEQKDFQYNKKELMHKFLEILGKYDNNLLDEKIFKFLNNIKNDYHYNLILIVDYSDIYWEIYKWSNKNYQLLICELKYQLIDELFKKYKYNYNNYYEVIEKYKKYINIIYDNIYGKQLNMKYIMDIYNLKIICERDNNIFRYYNTLFGIIWNNIYTMTDYLIANYIHINKEYKNIIFELEKENKELKMIFNNINKSYSNCIKNKN
jgi:hypothetical protein